jgi:hypothetical protein
MTEEPLKTHEDPERTAVLLFMPKGLADALTDRAAEIGVSRSELLRRLATSFTDTEKT